MENEDGTVHVIFNGEIYNHRELRSELSGLGHRFNSDHCDTEVLVHGWEQWKTDLPGKLRGMFAFAVWDSQSQELFLARDYFGQKPLFYAIHDGCVAFASTLPAVRCWPGVAPRASIASLRQYLQFGYIPPPSTVYRDIKCIEPGSWIRLTAGQLFTGVFWRPENALQMNGGVIKTVRDEDIHDLRQLIFSAVESQLHADVPMVGFLSGGIDSALVCGVARQLLGGRREMQVVTVGFDETSFDEMPLAGHTARAANLRHHQCRIDMKPSAMATLEWLMEFTLGQPFADSSILPTYWVANAARSLAPCAISGDGGDEIFGGYDRYRAARMLKAGLRLPRWKYRSERMRRMAAASSQKGGREQYTALCSIFQPEDLRPLGMQKDGDRDKSQPGMDVIRQCMLMDQSNYLPGDVLWKVDAASMACGLEVRSPLLDHQLANWANRFCGEVMMNWRQGKLLVRRAMRDFLPREVQRGRKRGFGVPIGQWFRSSLRGETESCLLAGGSLSTQLGLKMLPERLWKEHLNGERDHTHRLFALLMMEMWYRQNPNLPIG